MNETIDYYNKNADSFYETTVLADMSQQYEQFLKQLSANASILDLGCGSGRDSKYFLEHGYKVTSLDGSEELCNRASKLIGQDVICKPFQEVSFVQEFDGIWACASLLHVEKDELPNIFKRLSVALKENGILYCSFKYGRGEEKRNGRYFTDMTEEKLSELIAKVEGFEIVYTYKTGDVRPGRQNEIWLNGIIRKLIV